MAHPVPQPPLKPFIGNLASLDKDAPVQSMMALAREYGPFFKLRIFDRTIYFASSQELVNELCDETHFVKRVHPPLQELRALAGDGLFTAYNEEPNWGKAHRLLMPAFGPIGVRGMFDRMHDVAEQMMLRWERFGPDAPIDVADTMTRLTLDTIALCAFDTRFNSFYREEMHPFVGAMVGALSEAGQRVRRPKFVNTLKRKTKRRYEADQALLRQVAQELIAQRRADPKGLEKHDLLNLMLNGVDKETGEGLSDENIGYQMITFLIAGHETTSGLLSFATYLMLTNPEVLAKAQGIVDRVLGTEPPRVEHLAELRYLEQILMESLRLWPTASVFGVQPLEPVLLAGKYPLVPGDTINVLEPILHRDPAVWGPDPEAFRPERFAPDEAAKLPPNAWKPFGNGVRACIGRPFAMQEAQLVLAMMLQRFDLSLDDPGYQLKVHETLTLKPEGLRIRARARHPGGIQARAPHTADAPRATAAPQAEVAADALPLLVLFGGNAGSSEAFAHRLAAEAPAQGFRPSVAPMDAHADSLPTEGAVLIVTASYEGQPPDNARRFLAAIENAAEDALTGTRFGVFGTGNRQWARTWQAVPTRVDAALARAGAERLAPRGEADSGGDFFGAFDAWTESLWPTLAQAFGRAPAPRAATQPLRVEFLPESRARLLHLDDLRPAEVIENRELVDMTQPGARSKHHLEIALPEGMTYQTGDYLAVLAANPEPQVDRALRRFGLAADMQVRLQRPGGVASLLPMGQPLALGDLLAHYVELAQPASRAQVSQLAEATRCPPEAEGLRLLANDAYESEVLGKRLSVLDLLDRVAACALRFEAFLGMLPPMRARQYSISSSPLWNPRHATLTVAVLDAPALSGLGRHLGVSSTYLARLQPGDRISVAVRPAAPGFRPPPDPAAPMVLIAAGSGIAPFRGFLQERAALHAQGAQVGKALLFFGTRHPDIDDLYHAELADWSAQGLVEILPAYSRLGGEIRYVQHRLWQDRARLKSFYRDGAKVYLCGDGARMAPSVRQTLLDIYREETGADAAAATAWADEVEHRKGRFTADVFL